MLMVDLSPQNQDPSTLLQKGGQHTLTLNITLSPLPFAPTGKPPPRRSCRRSFPRSNAAERHVDVGLEEPPELGFLRRAEGRRLKFIRRHRSVACKSESQMILPVCRIAILK